MHAVPLQDAAQLLRQRVSGVVQGYEGLNDPKNRS